MDALALAWAQLPFYAVLFNLYETGNQYSWRYQGRCAGHKASVSVPSLFQPLRPHQGIRPCAREEGRGMKQFYIIFATAYVFIILTSYAVYDLFGINRGIFASIFIFFGLYCLDIVIDHQVFKRVEVMRVSQVERIKLTLFAAAFWILIEAVFIGLDMIFNGWGDFQTYLSVAFNPLFLLSGGLIGIAVYGSLGYGHSKQNAVHDSDDGEPSYLKNRETTIDIAKAIKKEKQQQRQNNEK